MSCHAGHCAKYETFTLNTFYIDDHISQMKIRSADAFFMENVTNHFTINYFG